MTGRSPAARGLAAPTIAVAAVTVMGGSACSTISIEVVGISLYGQAAKKGGRVVRAAFAFGARATGRTGGRAANSAGLTSKTASAITGKSWGQQLSISRSTKCREGCCLSDTSHAVSCRFTTTSRREKNGLSSSTAYGGGHRHSGRAISAPRRLGGEV